MTEEMQILIKQNSDYDNITNIKNKFTEKTQVEYRVIEIRGWILIYGLSELDNILSFVELILGRLSIWPILNKSLII